MARVYIANFGRGNWAWPECLRRNALTVICDARVHDSWLARDKGRYVEEAQRLLIPTAGERVTKNVASRWFNLYNVLMETAGDLWIHRERDELWWTRSIAGRTTIEIVDEPNPHFVGASRSYAHYKVTSAWTDRDARGRTLRWDGLHPRSKEFLSSEGTFQELSADNAAYGEALVNGDDLSRWHKRNDWAHRANKAGHGAAVVFDGHRKAIARMAATAFDTMAQSGELAISTRKEKDVAFRSRIELEAYLEELLRGQARRCALTDLEILPDGEDGDPEFRYSLDRIDSDGHYCRGNLQVVCKFVNRWKGASPDHRFRELIAIVRAGKAMAKGQ